MGYGSYTLSSGKEAGYLVDATCEHPGCNETIDRGMGHACGGEPGEQGGWSCEGYFCEKHLYFVGVLPDADAAAELRECVSMCAQCTSLLAFMDQIEEAEQYRADQTFAPDEGTTAILRSNDCKYVCHDVHIIRDDYDPRLDMPLRLDEAAPELEIGMIERQHRQRDKTQNRKKRMFRP